MTSVEVPIYVFGDFRLDVGESVLLRGGQPVRLQSKTLETLIVLVQNSGRVVTRAELMDSLWANTFVDENNLSQHIRLLRKALGCNEETGKYIETIPRRGYRFVAPVSIAGEIPEPQSFPEPPEDEPSPRELTPRGQTPTRAISVSRLVLVAIVVLAALSIGAGFYWRNKTQEVPRARTDASGLASRFERSNSEKIANADTSAISHDGRLIAYGHTLNGQNTLWLRQIASGRVSKVAAAENLEYRSPRFSADGEFINFLSPKDGQGHSYDLYRISIYGGAPRRIVSGINDYAVAPDGVQIAYFRTDHDAKICQLLTADPEGRDEKPISAREKPNCYGVLTYAADGRTILSTVGGSDTGGENTEIIETNAANGDVKSFTSERWITIREMVSLPEKKGIIVTGRKSDRTDFNRLWYVESGSGTAERISSNAVNYNSLSITGDGRTVVTRKVTLDSKLSIAYTDNAQNSERKLVSAYGSLAWIPGGRILFTPPNDRTLWAIDTDTGEQEQFAADDNIHISTSADGAYIASVRVTDGKFHIWRMNADGSGQIQLTFGDGEQRPAISPDNQWVYYHTVGGSMSTVWKVPIDGGDPVQVVESASTTPALSPDGSMLAFLAGTIDDVVILRLHTNEILARFPHTGKSISADRIRWSGDGSAVYYASQNADATGNIWRQPISGGPPAKITDFTADRMFDFQLSPDETQIAMNRGDWISEVVLITLPDL